MVTSKYGQDINKDAVMGIVTGGARTKYNATAGQWGGEFDRVATLAATVKDGQKQLKDRLDLLEGVNGYMSLFMGNNWDVVGKKEILLPFDQQLGPAKGAEMFQGGIKFISKGLWRSDTHVTFAKAPQAWFSGGPVNATVTLGVYKIADQSLYTAHSFDLVITVQGEETAAFSHTFVIPADNAYYAKVSVQHPKDKATVFGGTLRSALSVNRWDTGTENAVVAPIVPDGGTLS
ncbi:hypothetical protein AWN90_13625 [Nocardia terpenica]|uniref:Uncharacterized protein n=1 Tax=Nocardia terpenica TaxID=455432 RepID=A0A164HUF0_9NOCA|nr:hypothetical protein AWN90_13625 [Nocardia terpenica]